jgi:hypothetical protein
MTIYTLCRRIRSTLHLILGGRISVQRFQATLNSCSVKKKKENEKEKSAY